MDNGNYKIRNLFCKQVGKNLIFTTSLFMLIIFEVFCSSAVYSETITHQQLIKNADAVLSDMDNNHSKWFPVYHFASNGADISELAALVLFKDKYHLFFQQNFSKGEEKFNIWGHVQSDDLLHWKKLPSALTPYFSYDQDGISNGSAIIHDDLFYIFYTGKGVEKVVSDEQNVEISKKNAAHIVSTQNLATSKDGLYFGRSANNPVIRTVILNNKHEFSDENFANPYIWKHDEYFYALVGSQYKKTKDGAVLLYKSSDLRNWEIVNVSAIGQNGEAGYMWESPALFNVNEHDVLSISPKGIKPHGKLFLNKNQSGAFVGKLDYKTGKFAQQGAFMLYDYGFDFYSPKFVADNNGRVICMAYMGMEGTAAHESGDNWKGISTIPREVKVVNGKIHTIPVKELEGLRVDSQSVHSTHFNGEKSYFNLKSPVFELVTAVDLSEAKSFAIKFKYDVSNELVLSYDKDAQVLKLDRSKAGGKLSGEREVVLPLYENKLYLHIFSDKSSVEIFANNGPVAMTTRIYPEKGNTEIKFISDGNVKIEKLDLYKLKTIE